jgi:glycyl-tRNA synthetase beta chain
MNTLLLEIGSEEIPAGYIDPALQALSANLQQKLTDAHIPHGPVAVFGTPRRLTVQVKDMAAKQTSVSSEVVGPPAKVGFDDDGKPTVAAKKFAEKVGVPVDRLAVKETGKGSYLCVTLTEKGQPTRNLLKTILPEVILATPFPKKMRWADLDIEFARPIHYVVALLGKTVVSFELGNLRSNRYSRGHYFMDPARIKLADADAYAKSLKAANVLVDIGERKKVLRREIERVAAELGGSILPDEELVDINTHLVEYPIAVAGKFDKAFLEVPDEVLINAMREHQKYFSVMDAKGKLMPCFISVNNTRARKMSLVATGHERVIRARLADARFFYRGDLAVSNEERVEKLHGVLFQAQLGTMYEKTARVGKIAETIAERVEDADKTDRSKVPLKKRAARAAFLSKADLVSQVVGEFPKLQGVMGRIYATVAGELPTVSAAVEEHYRPVHSGGALPGTTTGAVLSIADKIDSICGCFSVGLVPTGASDPYALRRQGIGIIQIMQRRRFSFSLKQLIHDSLRLYGIKDKAKIGDFSDKVYTFIKNRIFHLLADEGFSKDVVAAVAEISVDDVPSVWDRVRALEALKAQPDFEPLVAGFKRVGNLLKKSGMQSGTRPAGAVQTDLFEHDSESKLYASYQKVAEKVTAATAAGEFEKALKEIATLRGPVDAFFDGVMVMADKKEVRANRLRLLAHIAALFEDLADFSKLAS